MNFRRARYLAAVLEICTRDGKFELLSRPTKTKMKLMKQWIVWPMLAVALAMTAGCEKGTGEKVGEKIDNAAEKTKDGVKDAAEKTGEVLKDAGDKVKDAVK